MLDREVLKEYANKVVDVLSSRGYHFSVVESVKNNSVVEIHVVENEMNRGTSEFSLRMSADIEPLILESMKETGRPDVFYAAGIIIQMVSDRASNYGVVQIDEDWKSAKNSVFLLIVNSERNEDLLKKVPHREFAGNLSIIYRVMVSKESNNLSSGVVTDALMNIWGVSESALYECAVANTPKIMPANIKDIKDTLLESLDEKMEEIRQQAIQEGRGDEAELFIQMQRSAFIAEFEKSDNIPMYILNNQMRLYGAAAILYPGMIEKLSERFGDTFYMIPSSIHEWIIIPMQDEMDEHFEDMIEGFIYDVNRNELDDREFLSDSLYMVCNGKVMIADTQYQTFA